MKIFIPIIFILLSFESYSQIIIRGAKNTEIIETNKNKAEVKEIKELNFTKSKEETVKPTYVSTNYIKNSKVETKEDKIEINISGNELNAPEKKILVIDLDKAKQNIDSTKNYNTNTNNFAVKETNSAGIFITKDENTTKTSSNISGTPVSGTNITGTQVTDTEAVSKQTNNLDLTNKPNFSSTNNNNNNNTPPKATETPILTPVSVADTEKLIVEEEDLSTIKFSNTENTPNTEEENFRKQNTESGIFIESPKTVASKTYTTETREEKELKPEEELELNDEKDFFVADENDESNEFENTKASGGNLNNLANLNTQAENKHSEKPIENLNDISAIDETGTENTKNPKSGSWSVSLRAGIPAIIGDVNSRAGYGVSLGVQKAMGHVFSLRFEALALETYGLSATKKNNTFPNYKTRFTDYTLQGVFTLNNLNFYTKEPKVLYNIIVGGGLATRYTWIDIKNESGILYNYDNINTSTRKETLATLNAMMDRKYETSIPKDADKMSIKNTNILPTIVFGFGIDVKLSEKFDLNLATRFSNHFDDNLDGLKSGKNTDWMSFSSLGLTYKFGSKNKSLLWTNPVYTQAEEIEDLKKKVNTGDLLKDEDKDGIADIFDQDLNTPEKVAVDSRGIPSDIDRDGVPDFEDAQPFTPIGAQVNEKGIALDSDNDGIADIFDLEKNTIAGNQVDANGRSIKTTNEAANKAKINITAGDSDFDLIFFDLNASRINKEFYSILYKVSRHIQANPNSKLQITGFTDVLSTEKYNLDLSEKRANAVYSMLVQMFKVDPNNLSTRFEGEKNPIIEGLPKQKDYSMEAAYYINRRVEIKILK